jgi:hypoxanthine phosphoribosyltransferase
MPINIGDKMFEPMLGHDEIQQRITDLGNRFNQDYLNQKPLFIGVLSGSFMFLADLMKVVTIPAEITFVKLASYEGERSSGNIKLEMGLSTSLKNRDVVIVEDIVDTGHTLKYLLEMIDQEKPKSVKVCSLLYKPAAVQYHFKELEYIGFEIPNDFVVGYGLDYDGLGRNLKDIYRLASV